MPPSALPEEPTPGPFISYSRKDEPFVRRLFEMLKARGRDAWVDWEDILPSAAWMREIRAGIDAAPAVIFVLSPDAIVSPVCKQEIDYALAQNKRLIPVVCRAVKADDVAEAVRELNWMQWAEPDAIEQHADDLLAALDTDLEWVRAHARLLVCAREWETDRADSSRLLRGSELKDYEQRLASISASQSPQPTRLQRQFVLASRQAQATRQRWLLIGVSAALIATVTLAIVAFVQSRIADQQRNIAVARLLAAQSLRHVTEATGRSDVALLLGVAATSIDPSPEAQQSLWRALLATKRARKFIHAGHTLLAVAVSPDGRRIATGGFGGEVDVWDTQTLQRVAADAAARGTGGVSGLAFSPDGSLLATATSGGVALRDAATVQVKRILNAGSDKGALERLTRVAWHPDGRSLFAASINNASIVSWDVASGERRSPISTRARGIRDMALSPDGKKLAFVGNDDTSVWLWNLDTGTEALRLEGHAGDARSVAFNHDGTLLASGDGDSVVVIHDVAGGTVLRTLQGQPGKIDSVAFSADGRRLVSGSNNRTIYLWDMQDSASPPKPEVLIGHGNGVIGVVFSADGKSLFSAGFEDTLIAWQVTPPPHQAALAANGAGIGALAVSRDGGVVASGGEDGTIRLWNRASRERQADPTRLEGHRGLVRALAFSADSSLLASGSDDDRRVLLWDVATGRELKQLDGERDVTAVAISPDSTLLAWACEGKETIQLWDLSTSTKRGELAGHDVDTTALAFAGDGKTLVSGGGDQAVRVWDLASGKETREPMGTGGTVAELALDPAGTMLASASHWPGGVQLRDLRRNGARDLPTGTPGGGNSVAFSPDGKTLAFTADEFRTTIVLWDVDRAMPRVALEARATVTSLAFTGNGTQLLSGHSDGYVMQWDVEIAQWPRRACEIANRNLTREEWQAAVGESLPYRPVCPGLQAPGS